MKLFQRHNLSKLAYFFIMGQTLTYKSAGVHDHVVGLNRPNSMQKRRF